MLNYTVRSVKLKSEVISMYTKQSKKLLIMNILDVLKHHSDVNHHLSQKKIIDLLKREYNMEADRKSIKRNLMNLIEFGYDLEYTEIVRRNKNGEEEVIYTDWYLNRDFSDAELRSVDWICPSIWQNMYICLQGKATT